MKNRYIQITLFIAALALVFVTAYLLSPKLTAEKVADRIDQYVKEEEDLKYTPIDEDADALGIDENPGYLDLQKTADLQESIEEEILNSDFDGKSIYLMAIEDGDEEMGLIIFEYESSKDLKDGTKKFYYEPDIMNYGIYKNFFVIVFNDSGEENKHYDEIVEILEEIGFEMH